MDAVVEIEEKKEVEETQNLDPSSASGQSQNDYNKEARYTSQDLDLERGNTRRARQEVDSIQTAYDGAQSEIETLKQQLVEKKEEKSSLENMDPELVDNSVKQNIQLLADEIKDLKTRNTTLEKKAQGYEQGIQQKEEQSRHDKARDEILTSIEAEDGVGPEHRNKAIAMANDLINSGKEQQPQGPIATRDLMSKCYREVANVSSTDNSKSSVVASDSGSAGVGHSEGSGIKSGSRESVKAQMLKDTSWKTER